VPPTEARHGRANFPSPPNIPAAHGRHPKHGGHDQEHGPRAGHPAEQRGDDEHAARMKAVEFLLCSHGGFLLSRMWSGPLSTGPRPAMRVAKVAPRAAHTPARGRRSSTTVAPASFSDFRSAYQSEIRHLDWTSCGFGGGSELPQPRFSIRGFSRGIAQCQYPCSLPRWRSFRNQDCK